MQQSITAALPILLECAAVVQEKLEMQLGQWYWEEDIALVPEEYKPAHEIQTLIGACLATIEQLKQGDWISPALQMPKTGQRCYVFCLVEEAPKPFQTMAEYIAPRTVLFEDYCSEEGFPEGGDYDEGADCYWGPAGWYEWQLESDTKWLLAGQVILWRPLFDFPGDSFAP